MKGKTLLGPEKQLSLFLFLLGVGISREVLGQTEPVLAQPDPGQEPRGSLAGEKAAQELKSSMTNEVFNMHWGPVSLRTEAKLEAAYTDNVFLSEANRREDYILYPQVNL